MTNLDGPSFTGLTIDAWIRPDTIVNSHAVAGVYNSSVTKTTYYLRVTNGKLNFLASWDPNWTVDFFAATSSLDIPVGQWTHVAGIWSGGSDVKLYIDGIEDTDATVNAPNVLSSLGETSVPIQIGALTDSANELYSFFNGLIDEVEIFNRALTAGEIRAIYTAGSAGKIKPEPIPPPAGMVSWWPGDGHANDIVDGNHGTLQDGATFALGMVDEAFSLDGAGDHVLVGGVLDAGTGSLTIDAWVRTNILDGSYHEIVSKNQTDFPNYQLYLLPSNEFGFAAQFQIGETHTVIASGLALSTGTWYHVAGVRDTVACKLRIYVDGVLQGEITPTTCAGNLDNAQPLKIGMGTTTFFWDGLIDEVEIFNRALTGDEVRAIYEAGSAGKIKP